MNNLFVYCEIEDGIVADVSLELLTKGRSLANQLGCQLEAVVAGTGLKDIEKQILPYGVDKLHVFDGEGLYPYTSLPHRYPGEPFQRRTTANLPDGCNRYRS